MNWYAILATVAAGLVVNVLSTVFTQSRNRVRLEGMIEEKFKSLDAQISELRGTMANAMSRLEKHGQDIAVLQDRSYARGASGR